MISFSLILLGLLIIVAIIDIKFKKIPSVLLTAMLFLTVLLNTQNIVFGVLAGLLMLLVNDIDTKEVGMADYKVMIMIGLMVGTIQDFFILALVFAIVQVVYIFTIRILFKFKNEEIAFIPCLLFVYVVLLLQGVI